MSPERSVKDLFGPYMRISGAGDGNRTHVRSLGSSYSAIELRPLALNLVDYTRLSESRTQRVFFLIFQN
jgi:hypothetical protein